MRTTAKVTFDAKGRFPERTENALQHAVKQTFDAGTGAVLTATDANDLTSSIEYDTLGRKTKEIHAVKFGDVSSAQPMRC